MGLDYRVLKYLIITVSLGFVAVTMGRTLFLTTSTDAVADRVAAWAQHETYITKPPRYTNDDAVFAENPVVPYEWFKENWRPGLSPYRIRWQDRYPYPTWAYKTENTVAYQFPPKSVCFVHIGKTGGSTIGCSLGFNLHCSRERYIPGGLLPTYTTHAMHNIWNDCPDNMPYYLFALRDPLERAKSAYLYDRRNIEEHEQDDHGQTALYVECPFFTLSDLALRGLAKDGNAPDFCKKRARNAIQGNKRHGYHLYYNYKYYLQFSKALEYDSSEVLVIRNNHMEEDWKSAEWAIGGEEKVETYFPHTNTAEKSIRLFDDVHLSPAAHDVLCQALCEEIQWYKKIIASAVNLSDKQKAQTVQELSCPVQAKATKCSKQ